MSRLQTWWKGGLSPWVKFTYLVLLANGVPAFFILWLIPDQTQDWFVWTVKPDASARFLGVMYTNALLLVFIGFLQPNWARARITLVLITFFSVAATIVTFFNLTPFLQHPWYHLAYWLSMYIILFFVAPVVFFMQEQAHGGKLLVEVPLSPLARSTALLGLVICGLTGLGLFISPEFINNFWPWKLTPLVGRILAVWFSSLTIAYGWALWDGDWLRTRPIFWQAIPTGLLALLVPVLNGADLGKDRGAAPALDNTGALILFVIANLLLAALGLITTLLSQPRSVSVEKQPSLR